MCCIASRYIGAGTVKAWDPSLLCSSATLHPSVHMQRLFTSMTPIICMTSSVGFQEAYDFDDFVRNAMVNHTLCKFRTHLRLVFLFEGPDLFIIVAVSTLWAYRFGPYHEFWTGLRLGSEKFGFELRFRTKPRHRTKKSGVVERNQG
jgi:hypothetical protein